MFFTGIPEEKNVVASQFEFITWTIWKTWQESNVAFSKYVNKWKKGFFGKLNLVIYSLRNRCQIKNIFLSSPRWAGVFSLRRSAMQVVKFLSWSSFVEIVQAV